METKLVAKSEARTDEKRFDWCPQMLGNGKYFILNFILKTSLSLDFATKYFRIFWQENNLPKPFLYTYHALLNQSYKIISEYNKINVDLC